MTPIHFVGQTQVLGEPPNWDNHLGACEGLPVLKLNESVFRSFWKPTWAERFRILFGQKVSLDAVGRHPPVWVSVAQVKERR